MIQPRLGATWAYNGKDTVFASYARYNPPASSTARAASWDRNLVAAGQRLLRRQRQPVRRRPDRAHRRASVGRPGIKPPQIKEFMLGTASRSPSRWSARALRPLPQGRRTTWKTRTTPPAPRSTPPAGVPRDALRSRSLQRSRNAPCGPNTIRGAIGSGSTYVIANLDGAFTKYYESDGGVGVAPPATPPSRCTAGPSSVTSTTLTPSSWLAAWAPPPGGGGGGGGGGLCPADVDHPTHHGQADAQGRRAAGDYASAGRRAATVLRTVEMPGVQMLAVANEGMEQTTLECHPRRLVAARA